MESLVHLQHGELPEERTAEVVEHLEICGRCADRAAFEDRILAELRDRLPRVPAPPGLRTRIVAALDEAAPAPGSRPPAWWRAPWLAATAAAVLLVGLLAVGTPSGGIEAVDAGVRQVSFLGTIVDHQCDAHGLSILAQRDCADPTHTNALRLDDGTYVQFSLHDTGSRAVVLDAAQRGRRVAAEGRYYRGIRTLAVSDLRDAGAVEL